MAARPGTGWVVGSHAAPGRHAHGSGEAPRDEQRPARHLPAFPGGDVQPIAARRGDGDDAAPKPEAADGGLPARRLHDKHRAWALDRVHAPRLKHGEHLQTHDRPGGGHRRRPAFARDRIRARYGARSTVSGAPTGEEGRQAEGQRGGRQADRVAAAQDAGKRRPQGHLRRRSGSGASPGVPTSMRWITCTSSTRGRSRLFCLSSASA